jgi:hypothetical protein
VKRDLAHLVEEQRSVISGFEVPLAVHRRSGEGSPLVPEENTLGKAVVVYWPISDWKVLKSSLAVLAAQ